MLVPKERRQKLDEKAKKLIMVGYEEGTKGYRLLNLETDKISISKDVIFVEDSLQEEDDSQQGISLPEMEGPEATVIFWDKNENKGRDVADEPAHSEGAVTVNQEVEGEPKNGGARSSERVNKGKPPARLIEQVNKAYSYSAEPRNYNEAINSEEVESWKKAMEEEMKSLKSKPG